MTRKIGKRLNDLEKATGPKDESKIVVCWCENSDPSRLGEKVKVITWTDNDDEEG